MHSNDDNNKNPMGLKFPVVLIGASAGGLEPLTAFIQAIPAASGCAFIIITHHRADTPSLLHSILTQHTQLPVNEARNGTRIEPDHIYTLPPATPFLALNGEEFCLLADSDIRHLGKSATESTSATQLHHPIDYAFRHLAFALKEDVIGVILSGSGSDGTVGIKAIKEANGMILAQDPVTAQFSSMPASAIATDMVDYVLAPEDMPGQIMAYLRAQTQLRSQPGPSVNTIPTWVLREIYMLLRTRTGHDFSLYKNSTLQRRIERRMGLNHITSAADYIQYLQENDVEIDLLFKDLLIRVTSFFRDPELWQECLERIFPTLMETHDSGTQIRVWVPGCATGEEAYTVAIILAECLYLHGKQLDIKLFATDLDLNAIEMARKGEFPLGIAADIPADLLKKYFLKKTSSYIIRKDIREMLVFAPQNVIKDPPFTRIDIISCRNLLIYMSNELQHQLLTMFIYALRDNGLLILGPSETPGENAIAFETLSKSWRVYRKKPYSNHPRTLDMDLVKQPAKLPVVSTTAPTDTVRPSANQFSTHVMRLLAQRFAPAAVITNESGEIYYIHGKTGMYLEPAEGRPRNNILEMARENLRIPVTFLFRQVTTQSAEIAKKQVKAEFEGSERTVLIEAERVQSPEALRGLYLFTFNHQDSAIQAATGVASIPVPRTDGNDDDLIRHMENELQLARDSYQTMVEELETANEELKSTNEELQSTNEELQSTNEELETSREEMQSLYEELSTVNSELQSKVDVLSHTNDDLQNLMNSTRIAIIFLDNDMRIKRFTEPAKKLIALRESDLGRPLAELASNLVYDNLIQDAREVLATLNEKHAEVATESGDWYQMRILPYRTVENVINGLSLCFININTVKQVQQFAAYLSQVIDSLPLPLLVIDASLSIKLANYAFCEFFKLPANQVETVSLRDLSGGIWDIPELLSTIDRGFKPEFTTAQMTLKIRFPKIGTQELHVRIGSLTPGSGGLEKEFVTLTLTPVTEANLPA